MQEFFRSALDFQGLLVFEMQRVNGAEKEIYSIRKESFTHGSLTGPASRTKNVTSIQTSA